MPPHHHSDHHSHHHHHDENHHPHDHDHQHGHHEQAATPMGTPQKLAVLLKHWVSHNHDHAHTYEEWAEKADLHNLPVIGAALRQAMALTHQISQEFEKASAELSK